MKGRDERVEVSLHSKPGGGVLPKKRLMGISAALWCRIFTTGLTVMGTRFQWSNWNGVAHFRIFWDNTALHIYG